MRGGWITWGLRILHDIADDARHCHIGRNRRLLLDLDVKETPRAEGSSTNWRKLHKLKEVLRTEGNSINCPYSTNCSYSTNLFLCVFLQHHFVSCLTLQPLLRLLTPGYVSTAKLLLTSQTLPILSLPLDPRRKLNSSTQNVSDLIIMVIFIKQGS